MTIPDPTPSAAPLAATVPDALLEFRNIRIVYDNAIEAIRDGKATQVDLVDDGTYQNHWIVTDGLEPGELLAVDNLAALSDGATVTTVPVTLDENGVVREQPAPEAAAETAPAAE